jgi:archaellum component FlaC
MGERLAFRRIVLTGPGRNYDVVLKDGVNLVAGPIWTGKSSVLRLLDYACGAKSAPSYPEISKCSDLYVECLAGGETLTIRRSLKSATAKATLYAGPLASVFEHALRGTEVSARHLREAASVSSEVLQRLGLGDIDVKAAPTQDASESSAFSLRDLLMLVYVDQDRMGSARSGFFEDHPFKSIKWRAAFEIVHGLFDESTARLASSLKDAETEEEGIRQYLRNAQTFLDDFKIPQAEDLERQIKDLAVEKEQLKARLHDLRQNAEAQMGGNFELVTRREKFDNERTSLSARIGELRRSLAQLGRLRVQYDRERAQLEFLKESEALVGGLPVTRCPACLQPIESSLKEGSCYVCHRALPRRDGEVSADARLRSTKRRISDLEDYIAEIEGTVEQLEEQRRGVASQVEQIDQSLRRLREAVVLPDTRALAEANEALGLVEKRKRQAEEHLELRKKARGEGSSLLAVAERIGRLRADLEKATASKASPDAVVDTFSDLFVEILREIRFPEMRDSRVDKQSYLPVARNQPYGQLSSKGAIALAMVAWHLALLRYSVSPGSRFPRLLMLDSPLSHVGHDASDEQFKDQQIVEAFYALLLRMHRTQGAEFQMIIVDNRPPLSAGEMVAVNFTRDAAVGRFGLIDDEHTALPKETDRPGGGTE